MNSCHHQRKVLLLLSCNINQINQINLVNENVVEIGGTQLAYFICIEREK